MKIPITTTENPLIEFRFDKKGNIYLKATSGWWGGKNSGFISSDGSEGNVAPPEELKAYIKAYNQKKVKELEKEIKIKQNRLEKIKSKSALFLKQLSKAKEKTI